MQLNLHRPEQDIALYALASWSSEKEPTFVMENGKLEKYCASDEIFGRHGKLMAFLNSDENVSLASNPGSFVRSVYIFALFS